MECGKLDRSMAWEKERESKKIEASIGIERGGGEPSFSSSTLHPTRNKPVVQCVSKRR